MSRRIDASIHAVIRNATRLLQDAEYLEFSEPPVTAWYLARTAQEELAKAFMLCLTSRGVVPWSSHVLRALRDHKCKQLLCVVMDYLEPDNAEFFARIDEVVQKNQLPSMPRRVADALNILRYEKIGRWVSQSWEWAEDPDYDDEALSIAKGKEDVPKQDALYVRIGKDGTLASTPLDHSHLRHKEEMERAGRYKRLVESLLEGSDHPGLDWDEVENALRLLFSDVEK